MIRKAWDWFIIIVCFIGGYLWYIIWLDDGPKYALALSFVEFFLAFLLLLT